MSKTKKREKLLILIRKYLDGTASSKEKEFVKKYYRFFSQREAPSTGFSETEKKEIEDRMLQNIHKDIMPASHKSRKLIFNNIYVRVSAAVFLALIVTGLLFRFSHTRDSLMVVNNKTQVQDILPGGNKATLTLANDSVIALNRTPEGVFLNRGNIQIIKSDSGQLVYQLLQTGSKHSVKASGEADYNTLATPVGGNYSIVLSDGSRVWLNASSSLRFPTAFHGAERRVEVRGEVYFEVAKDDAHPFVVQIYGSDGEDMGAVQVLGTHFNINAYMDNQVVKTTLTEGVVKIIKGRSRQLLKPGEQATTERQKDRIEVAKANTKEAIAWKNGFFLFEDTDIVSIMHQISRWYDVEVSYNGKPYGRYSGIISRQTKLSEVLKVLEAGGFNFKIAGKKVIVNP